MKDAQGRTVSLRIGGESSADETVEFAASGTVITFRGFLAAYEEGRDDDRAEKDDDEERRLPNLAEGDAVELRELEPQGHETSPPARYTEATLVRTLEELGIGRPSTYASIIGTILDRGYVFKRGDGARPGVPRLLGRRTCSSSTSAGSSTTTSRPGWRTTSTGSPPATSSVSTGSAASTSATTATTGCTSSSPTSARSTRARSTRSRSATGSSSASAATGRTSSATA